MRTTKILFSSALINLCLYAGAAAAATHPAQFAKGTRASVVKGVVEGSNGLSFSIK